MQQIATATIALLLIKLLRSKRIIDEGELWFVGAKTLTKDCTKQHKQLKTVNKSVASWITSLQPHFGYQRELTVFRLEQFRKVFGVACTRCELSRFVLWRMSYLMWLLLSSCQLSFSFFFSALMLRICVQMCVCCWWLYFQNFLSTAGVRNSRNRIRKSQLWQVPIKISCYFLLFQF